MHSMAPIIKEIEAKAGAKVSIRHYEDKRGRMKGTQCIIEFPGGQFIMGESKCDKHDTFDHQVGSALALSRAVSNYRDIARRSFEDLTALWNQTRIVEQEAYENFTKRREEAKFRREDLRSRLYNPFNWQIVTVDRNDDVPVETGW